MFRRDAPTSWRRRDPLAPLELVGNAEHPTVDMKPGPNAAAEAIRAAWAPLVPGQAIPMLGERRR